MRRDFKLKLFKKVTRTKPKITICWAKSKFYLSFFQLMQIACDAINLYKNVQISSIVNVLGRIQQMDPDQIALAQNIAQNHAEDERHSHLNSY